MEEKQMNENKEPELKGKMGIVWLTGILVIILGCVTVYTLKLCKENKELKQTTQQPQVVAPTQEPSKTQNSILEVTGNKLETTAESESDNKKFIGSWSAEIGPDGIFEIEIKEKDGKLDIKWVDAEFNLTPAKTYSVKNYKIENDKLYVKVDTKNTYPESNFIIYKKNNKMYLTIENEKDSYFPVELNSTK